MLDPYRVARERRYVNAVSLLLFVIVVVGFALAALHFQPEASSLLDPFTTKETTP